ncbi:hypothetical protein Gogos_003875, partial [Gossypium gossypioides]|nr:hypothetical protein [Gossypium gossypioides]
EVTFGWDISLKAVPKKALSEDSRWLRDDSSGSNPIGIDMDDNKGVRSFGDIQKSWSYKIRGGKGDYLAAKSKANLQSSKGCFNSSKQSRPDTGLESYGQMELGLG